MQKPGQSPRRGAITRQRPAAIIVAAVVVVLVAGALVATWGLSGGTAGRAALSDVQRSARVSPGADATGTPVPGPDRDPSSAPAPRDSRSTATAAASGGAASTPAPVPHPASGTSTCTKPQFVTSAPMGGWADGDYYVFNNMWNISGYSVTQTLYACSSSNWYVVADMNNDSGNGAVKTYPNVQETFSEPAISSFKSISSTFAEASPHIGIYEDAYDIWLNGIASSGSTEVMIWTENFDQSPSGSAEATASLGGRGYHVWRTSSGSYIAFVADTNFTSGTVNLLQVFDWLIARGWIPAGSTLGQIDYGAEIVSTDNVPSTFTFTNFSVRTSS
jgi:Glycosyl hydrolase family 12